MSGQDFFYIVLTIGVIVITVAIVTVSIVVIRTLLIVNLLMKRVDKVVANANIIKNIAKFSIVDRVLGMLGGQHTKKK